MAGLIDELVSGVVDAALKEVLKKTGVRKTTAKRTRRRTTTRKKASGGILGDIIEAVLKPAAKTPRSCPPHGQESHRHVVGGGHLVREDRLD